MGVCGGCIDDEDDEEDEDGVILRLEEGINGINVFDHIEVFGRDNSFANEALHVMPVEVFGSRRPGRTTSIYSLLGRTGDAAVPSRHPLLLEPSFILQPPFSVHQLLHKIMFLIPLPLLKTLHPIHLLLSL